MNNKIQNFADRYNPRCVGCAHFTLNYICEKGSSPYKADNVFTNGEVTKGCREMLNPQESKAWLISHLAQLGIDNE